MRIRASLCLLGVSLWCAGTARAQTNAAPLDIGFGRAYPILSSPGFVYQLEGRASPFTSVWYAINSPLPGTGGTIYGFESGEGPAFLPARRFHIRTNSTDGLALTFDGVNDFLYAAHDARLNLTNGMTLAAWVKPAATGVCTLIGKASSPALVCYSLGLDAANRPVFRIFAPSGSTFAALTGTTALAVGTWRHVAATWNGAQAATLVDGQVEATAAAAGTTRVSGISALTVGSIAGSEAYAGLLDQVQVWNVGRAAIDIASDFQTQLIGSEPGLVGLWPFRTNEGQAASDATANGLHLVVGSDMLEDANDPLWYADSFPPPSAFEEIFTFGERCLVVGHSSQTGLTYSLERGLGMSPGVWITDGGITTGLVTRTEYILWPTSSLSMFRLWGPPYSVEPPAGMTHIPSGSFVMGHPTNMFSGAEGEADELPQHTVLVSGFFMDRTEVSKALWDTIRTWALSNGYSFVNAGAGKGTNHPVQSVAWYDAVKWCNARSERDGFQPSYSVGGNVYRTGVSDTVACNMAATGFRIPTEAEWERAARGGHSFLRFPWATTTTISHVYANFRNNGGESYAVGTLEYHPVWGVGGLPYTCPVGTFPTNGFGLSEMGGNVWEWCWDWHSSGYYAISGAVDPSGPTNGTSRVLRGGSYGDAARFDRCASRHQQGPAYFDNGIGFRCVRRP